MPNRLQTEWTLVLGDKSVTPERLQAYGQEFARIRLEVASHLGVTCPLGGIEVYGSEEVWKELSYGFADALYWSATNRILVADLHSAPRLQTQGMVREYVVRCGPWDGKYVPRWIVQGLALNESWRVDEGRPDWNTQALESQWEDLTGGAQQPAVPDLVTGDPQDPISATAMGYLLQNHGGEAAVKRFFTMAYQQPYWNAFSDAFGISPEQYQVEYQRAVEARAALR